MNSDESGSPLSCWVPSRCPPAPDLSGRALGVGTDGGELADWLLPGQMGGDGSSELRVVEGVTEEGTDGFESIKLSFEKHCDKWRGTRELQEKAA